MILPVLPWWPTTFAAGEAPQSVLFVAISEGLRPWTRSALLELARAHTDRGDRVHIASCRWQLESCFLNPSHDLGACAQCTAGFRDGVEELDARVSLDRLPISRRARRIADRFVPRAPIPADQLRDLTYRTFDVGMATLSSFVSRTRDPDFQPADAWTAVAGAMRSAVALYEGLLSYLTRRKTDLVYVYNGRLPDGRATLRACQALGIPCAVFEHGADPRVIRLSPNGLPHEIALAERQIRALWSSVDPANREALGAEFFERRAREAGENTFTAAQEAGRLPDGWAPSARNIVAFTSSEDEFVAIGDEWKPPIYRNQVEGLARLAESLPSATLWIRIHPNSKSTKGRFLAQLEALRAKPNVRVVEPESRVSSYAVMRAADIVVSFGSTIGIEATYWGRPSVLLGASFYQSLGACYRPKSHEEAVELLRRPLEPCAREGALMYGLYLHGYGHRIPVLTEKARAAPAEASSTAKRSRSMGHGSVLAHWLTEPKWRYMPVSRNAQDVIHRRLLQIGVV